MLRVYYADFSKMETKQDLSLFSDYRKNRLAAISDLRLKKAGITAERLLNTAVQECFPQIKLPLKISQNSYGKPEADGFYFNLSHSGNFSACAISDVPVGFDIQKQACFNDAFVKRFFTYEEYQFLRDSKNKDHDFTSFWCLKESYLKAIGTGLVKPLNSFNIKKTENKFALVEGQFALWHSVIDSMHFALCSEKNAKPDCVCRIELL